MKKFLLVFLACLTVFWSLIIPASAAQPAITSLPEFPEKPYSATGHVVFYQPQNDLVYLLYYDILASNNSFSVYNIVDGSYTFTLQGTKETSQHVITEYVLRDGAGGLQWVRNSRSYPTIEGFLWKVEKNYTVGQSPTFYYSTNDVVTPDGAVFFPATRLTLEQAVQTGLLEMKQKTDGNLMTLAVCGVGCLALLMGLLLLSSKFKNFLR